MFINIEGPDLSGKTIIAKELAIRLKGQYYHEPTFTSEKADKLNQPGINPWIREYYFLKDRMKNQSRYSIPNTSIVLDRYILSGLAYARVFSPQVLEMISSIYSLSDFKQPDVVFYIKTDLSFNYKMSQLRGEVIDLKQIEKLQNAFYDSFEFLRIKNIPFFIVNNDEDKLEKTIDVIQHHLIEIS